MAELSKTAKASVEAGKKNQKKAVTSASESSSVFYGQAFHNRSPAPVAKYGYCECDGRFYFVDLVGKAMSLQCGGRAACKKEPPAGHVGKICPFCNADIGLDKDGKRRCTFEGIKPCGAIYSKGKELLVPGVKQ